MKEVEEYVIKLFKDFGITATKIPESSEESPDFFINHENRKILVELKTKIDSEQVIEKRDSDLNKGEIHQYESISGRKNTISGVVKKASGQLDTHKDKTNSEFCFLFFLSASVYSDLQFEQIKATLYGSKTIISIKEKILPPKECYYYSNSDYYNFRHVIDGAIVVSGESIIFCINNLSPNYPEILEIGFVRAFIPAILDPERLEKEGKAYLITEALDRKDENSLNSHLENKYDLGRIIAFNWPRIILTSRRELE